MFKKQDMWEEEDNFREPTVKQARLLLLMN